MQLHLSGAVSGFVFGYISSTMHLTKHHCSLVDHTDLLLTAMAFKFVVFAALVAYAQAGALLSGPAAIATPFLAGRQVLTKVSDAEFDPNPQYSYSYNVADSITGDFKHQAETRDGDVVRGSYSLLESDGTRRVVDYAADALSGFNAVVRKEPAAVAIPAPAPIAVKTAIPAAIPAPAPIAVRTAFPAPITRFAAALPALAGPAPLAVAGPAPLPLAAAPAPLPYAAAAPLPYGAAPAFPAFTNYAAPGFFRSGPIIKSFY